MMVTYIVFDNFKDLVDREVVCRLQSSVHSAPWEGRPFLAIWLELKQGVVDAVEEDLVVDVLALRQECLQHGILGRAVPARRYNCLSRLRLLFFFSFCNEGFALFFSPLLKRQVQIQWQHLRVSLVKVLATAYLRVLQLVQQLDGILAERFEKILHKLLWVLYSNT